MINDTELNNHELNKEQAILAEELLKDLNRIENESETNLDLENETRLFHDKLTLEQAKILMEQQQYTDYLNREANTFERLVAYVIDLTTIVVLSLATISIILLSVRASLPQVHSAIYSNRLIELIILTVFAIHISYFTILDARKFSTIGKHLTNIKVIDEFGETPGLFKSFLRTILSVLIWHVGILSHL